MKSGRKKRFVSYSEKLKDRRWQERRLRIMERDNFCCQYPNCPSEKSMLEVHHKVYLRNTDVWDYPDFCLITYCHDHHVIEQNRMEQAHLAIANNPILIQYCIDHEKDAPAFTPRKRPPEIPPEPEPILTEQERLEKGASLFAEMRKAIGL